MNSRTLVTLGLLLLSGCFTPVDEWDGPPEPPIVPKLPAARDAGRDSGFGSGDAGRDAGYVLDSGLKDAGHDAGIITPPQTQCDAGTVLTSLGCEVPPFPAPAAGQHTVSVATDGGSFWGARDFAMRLDRFGNPMFAFPRRENPSKDKIVLTQWTGSAWSETVIDTASSSHVYDVAMAIDEKGAKHLAYRKDYNLYYTRADVDGGITRELILSTYIFGDTRNDILVAGSGVVHVAFVAFNSAMVATRPTGGAWTYANLATGPAPLVRLAWSAGRLVAATKLAELQNDERLYLHESSDSGWTQTLLRNIPRTTPATRFSFAGAPDGGIRLALIDPVTKVLSLGSTQAGGWVEEAPNLGLVQTAPNVDVGAMDPHPHATTKIAFKAQFTGPEIVLAESTSAGWTTRRLPVSDSSIENVTLLIGPDGSPHIAWFTGTAIRYWH